MWNWILHVTSFLLPKSNVKFKMCKPISRWKEFTNTKDPGCFSSPSWGKLCPERGGGMARRGVLGWPWEQESPACFSLWARPKQTEGGAEPPGRGPRIWGFCTRGWSTSAQPAGVWAPCGGCRMLLNTLQRFISTPCVSGMVQRAMAHTHSASLWCSRVWAAQGHRYRTEEEGRQMAPACFPPGGVPCGECRSPASSPD